MQRVPAGTFSVSETANSPSLVNFRRGAPTNWSSTADTSIHALSGAARSAVAGFATAVLLAGGFGAAMPPGAWSAFCRCQNLSGARNFSLRCGFMFHLLFAGDSGRCATRPLDGFSNFLGGGLGGSRGTRCRSSSAGSADLRGSRRRPAPDKFEHRPNRGVDLGNVVRRSVAMCAHALHLLGGNAPEPEGP